MGCLPWAVATLLLCSVPTIDSDAVYAGDLAGQESSSTSREPLLVNQDRVIYYNEAKNEYVRWTRDDCGDCEGTKPVEHVDDEIVRWDQDDCHPCEVPTQSPTLAPRSPKMNDDYETHLPKLHEIIASWDDTKDSVPPQETLEPKPTKVEDHAGGFVHCTKGNSGDDDGCRDYSSPYEDQSKPQDTTPPKEPGPEHTEPGDPTPPPKVLKPVETKPGETTAELTPTPAPTDPEEPTPAPTDPGDAYPEPTPAMTTTGANPDTTKSSSRTGTGASASAGADNDTISTTKTLTTTDASQGNATAPYQVSVGDPETGTGATTSNAMTSDTTTSTGDTGSGGLSGGGIAGIVVACAVVVAVVIGAVLFHQRSIARQREENLFAELSDTALEVDYAAM